MKCLYALALCIGSTLLAWPWAVGQAATRAKNPPTAVPAPIAISRVRVEVRQGRALVTEDVTLPAVKGKPEDLDIHVAFGGPGVPLAFDAQLIETPKGYLVAPADATGARLTHTQSFHAPSHTAFAIGRPEMAGALVHVGGEMLADRSRASGQATLRLREVRDLPGALADQSRELLVRLGAFKGKPYVLGLIEVVSDESLTRIGAQFCASDKGPALFVAGANTPGAVAPPLAQRSQGDDLCVRLGPAKK